MARASAVLAVIVAEYLATMTVKPRASAKAMIVTTTALILQDHRMFVGSYRSGQKRSKKNPAPKIVATAIPTLNQQSAMNTC